jgi:ubiquinone/menaquinone biosynthesis C-methylase UbiE
MAERAHPDIKGFQKKYSLVLKNGFIPTIINASPYSEAFYWRYNWANNFCKNKSVLEVPCGMGWGTSLLKKADSIIGVDISEEAINEAKLKYGNSRLQFQVGSMEKLPFADNSFDIVLCLEGIEHVDENIGKKFIAEASRVLKPKGTLLVSSPRHKTKEHSGNPYHIIEYRLPHLIEVMSNNFLINSVLRRSVDDLNVYFIAAENK